MKHRLLPDSLTASEKDELVSMLEYETGSRWWTGFIEWSWLQSIAVNYLHWLTRRKYMRFRQYRHYRRIHFPTLQN